MFTVTDLTVTVTLTVTDGNWGLATVTVLRGDADWWQNQQEP